MFELVHVTPESLWAGYGAFGHVISGVSVAYAYRFPGQGIAALVSTHSFAFSTLLDTGWIGLLVVVALLTITLSGLASQVEKSQSVAATAVLAVLVYFTLAGFTESTPTIYGPTGSRHGYSCWYAP